MNTLVHVYGQLNRRSKSWTTSNFQKIIYGWTTASAVRLNASFVLWCTRNVGVTCKKVKFVICCTALHASRQLLSTSTIFVSLQMCNDVLQWSIASSGVFCSKCLLQAYVYWMLFIMFALKQGRLGWIFILWLQQFLSALKPVLIDKVLIIVSFHLWVRICFQPRSFDPVLHGHHGYTIACRHVRQFSQFSSIHEQIGQYRSLQDSWHAQTW